MQHADTPPRPDEHVASIVQATADTLPHQPDVLAQARAFVQPLLANMALPSGENTFAHAEGVARILAHIGSAANLQAAAYLVYAVEHLSRPQELIEQVFGKEFADLALESMRLMHLQRMQRMGTGAGQAQQIEVVRKMLLAFSRDLRVILLRLASRLQTLRYFAASKKEVPQELAAESLHVLAPLANRLGIWQIKWELEDLAFRFLEPQTYRQVAQWLHETREQREQRAEQLRQSVQQGLAEQGIQASVQARPKHIYSIVKKMRGKALDFSQIYDVMALRVIVPDVKACYTTLSWVHSLYEAVSSEFDDYIAHPKANGYQSLHTVVQQPQADGSLRPIEIQIRTQAMHAHAETGVAAHWAYKEAGAKGYAGHTASSAYESKIAVLRQLLAWERDLVGDEVPAQAKAGAKVNDQSAASSEAAVAAADAATVALLQDRIYVLTPNAEIVELPQGATPVDFAYSVHTTLGHRCRGARVDGVMVPLNTPLQNGQTVEITAAKEGGPSRDWLNGEQGYLASHRARAKVRAWFNALVQQDAIARGREAVEKLLQREGKTALKLDELAARLGFSGAHALFEVVGKDEFSLRNIELLIKPQGPPPSDDEIVLQKQSQWQGKARAKSLEKGAVLVVGMGSLMTQLGKCCKPAPPDPIGGFVTRGKGVSVHRLDCANYRHMLRDAPERAIDVQWSAGSASADGAGYPVDLLLQTTNRPGLLRDITELFARDKTPISGMQTEPGKGGVQHMTLTVQVANTNRLRQTLIELGQLDGVIFARRRH